jgi:hypothetical protein
MASDDEQLVIDAEEGCIRFFRNIVKEPGKDSEKLEWTRKCLCCNQLFKGGIQKGKQASHVGHFKAKGVTVKFCQGAAWTEDKRDLARTLTQAGQRLIEQLEQEKAAEIERALLVKELLEERHMQESDDHRRCSPRMNQGRQHTLAVAGTPPRCNLGKRKRQVQKSLEASFDSKEEYFHTKWARCVYHQGNLAVSFTENPYFVEFVQELAAADSFEFNPPKRTKYIHTLACPQPYP